MTITYRCTLSAAGFSDVVVPISSFQLRLRQAPLLNYLSVVIPKILTYADVVSVREDGEVTLTHISGATETDILADANISAVRFALGAVRRTGTIVSYKTITYPGTGSITIPKPRYRSSDGTVLRYRAQPDPTLKPGDDAIITGWETISVDEIAWTVDPGRSIMEFSGA